MRIIGFDTETVIRDHIHEPYSFQIYSDDLNLRIFETDVNKLRDYFSHKTRSARWICANLEFDISVVSKILRDTDLKVKLIYGKNRLIRAEIFDRNKHKWHFLDIFNVYNMRSLDSIGKAIGIPKLAKPSYLGNRAPVGLELGYFREYALNDAKICYYAAKAIFDEFKVLKATAGSLSLKYIESQIGHRFFFPKFQSEVDQKFRQAYRGGRCEAFVRGLINDKCYYYDYKNFYGQILSEIELPMINKQKEGRYQHKASINLDHEGIAKVTVKVDSDYPVLGVRRSVKTKDKLGRSVIGSYLIFPSGYVTDYFTYPELRYLEESNEGKICKVIEAYEWLNKVNPMQDVIKDLCYKKQVNVDKASLYKVIINSCYGKFGEIRHGAEYEVDDDGHITVKPSVISCERSTRHTCVPWAAYIAGEGRIRIHNAMKSHNFGKIYYCDTDGFISSQKVDCDNRIKVEYETDIDDSSIFIRSKFYAMGEKIRCRGISVSVNKDAFRKILSKGEFGATQIHILTFRAATRRDMPLLYHAELIKTMNLYEDGKRHYEKLIRPEKLISDMSRSYPIQLCER